MCLEGMRAWPEVCPWLHDNADALLQAITRELDNALSLDETDADVHRIFRGAAPAFNRFDKALHHQERALELCPNYDLVVVQQGEVLTGSAGPRKASSGSARRCASTLTSSDSGITSGGRSTSRARMPTRWIVQPHHQAG
jgi:hypothetical protein